jgi:hypothetical protein
VILARGVYCIFQSFYGRATNSTTHLPFDTSEREGSTSRYLLYWNGTRDLVKAREEKDEKGRNTIHGYDPALERLEADQGVLAKSIWVAVAV